MREEEHLQECRELIAENIRRYEAQVEGEAQTDAGTGQGCTERQCGIV